MKKTLILLLAIILILPITIKAEINKKEIKVTDYYDISEFFTDQEINRVYSTKEKVAEIKNNELVLHKLGKTDLIYEDNENYKVIHLTVTEKGLGYNPKTSATSVFAVLLGAILITSLVTFKKKSYY